MRVGRGKETYLTRAPISHKPAETSKISRSCIIKAKRISCYSVCLYASCSLWTKVYRHSLHCFPVISYTWANYCLGKNGWLNINGRDPDFAFHISRTQTSQTLDNWPQRRPKIFREGRKDKKRDSKIRQLKTNFFHWAHCLKYFIIFYELLKTLLRFITDNLLISTRIW